jgi:HEAT repeat protein
MGEGAAPAVPALIAALADANELVRGEAAAALGRMGPTASAAAAALVRARSDADPGVRAAATDALRKVKAAR